MGVDSKTYLIIGNHYAYKDAAEVESDCDNNYGLKVIADGMGGEYVVIGRVIVESDDYNGFDFTEINHYHQEQIPEVSDEIKEVFPELPNAKTSVYLFTHYS